MPKAPSPTIYSNVINIRTTPTELILEFSNFFPEASGGTAGPNDTVPEIRVVLPKQALQELADALNQATQASKPASSSEGAPKAPTASKAK